MTTLVLRCATLLLTAWACLGLAGPRPRPRALGRAATSMSLTPIAKPDMQLLSPRKVTTDQWTAYWGTSKSEQVQKVLESVLLSYGGAWMAWFLSFMAGSYVSAFVGTALVFNWMYTPWIYAKKRNSKLWPPMQTLHYALFQGRILSLSKVRRRAGKTIGGVSQEFLVVKIEDDNGRDLEIITQWRDAYKRLRPQMRCEAVIASPDEACGSLAMASEVRVPAAQVWVGDYPYLNRAKFVRYVREVGAELLPLGVLDVEPARPRDYELAERRGGGRGSRPRAGKGGGEAGW